MSRGEQYALILGVQILLITNTNGIASEGYATTIHRYSIRPSSFTLDSHAFRFCYGLIPLPMLESVIVASSFPIVAI